MTIATSSLSAYDDGDIDTNRTTNPHLGDLIATRYSRRQTLFGGLSAAGAAVFGGMLLAGCGGDDDAEALVATASGTGASAGRPVTLTGSVASGEPSTVLWSQMSGPTVSLTSTSTLVTGFTAPAVTTATNLGFRLEVTSRDGVATTTDTSVTVSPAQLGFTAVAKSLADVVAVPAGYNVSVLYRTGDPIAASVSAYANNGTDGNFAQRAGDHHDGMTYFGVAAASLAPDRNNSLRGLLALNHENISGTVNYLHANGPTTAGGVRPEAEAIKEIEAHGVSVVEVVRASGTGAWSYVQGSAANRRVTPNTVMTINGPARGNAQLRTRFSPAGTDSRGTINNCANGTMPWNTYLTAEENWAGYYRRAVATDVGARAAAGRAKENVSLARYGVASATGNYGWSTVVPADPASTIFSRWNANVIAGTPADGTGDFSHDPFTMGWIVEIDPFNAASIPRKRTALGRMNHEGCEIGRTIAGVRPAFYMGDDAQNEYIYKFVSAAPWVAADANAADRLAIGDKYLDAGTLYVARFNADGSGAWLPLVFGQGPLTSANATYSFADQADVLINTRLAADLVGATRMDRPEWTAVNPATGEMYCTLTNNTSRTPATTDASNPRAYTDPKLPQGDLVNADPPTTAQATRGNANGHVVRLRETGDTSEATGFAWDIYAFGSGADLNATNVNLSALDASNDFSSPDGLWFGLPSNVTGQATPLLWLQTDDGAYTDVTNCMMLAGIPGQVGDGAVRTVNNTLTTAAGVTTTSTTVTRAGAAVGAAALRRFMVGPKECEITGVHSTPDGRSLFVNIQHPGEGGTAAAPSSNWPASQTGAAPGSRPRSSTVVVTRADGGIIGL